MFKKIISLALLCAYGASVNAAGIVIIGTRVVYPAEQKSVGIQVKNMLDEPALAQAWVEDPNDMHANTPFTVTPAVSRVDGKMSQTIRIYHTGENMPQNKESLFYFNLLDAPPKKQPNEQQPTSVQFSVRSKLKFFYRPANLPYDVVDAYDKVNWHVSGKTLTIKNPTPYHITYSYVALNQGKQKLAEVDNVGMLAPFSERSYALNQAVPQANQVEWSVITDAGGTYGNSSPLQH